ncbi:MAG TPA: hypothetical protein PKC18_07145 [Lacipirellulaceae bacterium]|nr:hypothetical protein [Lacipirellulaceae bacterium]HMP06141.1 hypothetical protein [Lacipirellulaceae bacterium]
MAKKNSASQPPTTAKTTTSKPCRTAGGMTYVQGGQTGNTTSTNVRKAQEAVNKLKGTDK